MRGETGRKRIGVNETKSVRLHSVHRGCEWSLCSCSCSFTFHPHAVFFFLLWLIMCGTCGIALRVISFFIDLFLLAHSSLVVTAAAAAVVVEVAVVVVVVDVAVVNVPSTYFFFRTPDSLHLQGRRRLIGKNKMNE